MRAALNEPEDTVSHRRNDARFVLASQLREQQRRVHFSSSRSADSGFRYREYRSREMISFAGIRAAPTRDNAVIN